MLVTLKLVDRGTPVTQEVEGGESRYRYTLNNFYDLGCKSLVTGFIKCVTISDQYKIVYSVQYANRYWY